MAHNQTVGAAGEAVAMAHLRDAGFRIAACNWRSSGGDVRGELDIVAWDGAVLVFCEVKTRRAGGDPLEAVTARKQQQLRRLAAAYLRDTGVRANQLRFDAIAVSWPHGTPVVSHVRGVCT